jgi:N-acetylmuramoyl-L-alanine amidase
MSSIPHRVAQGEHASSIARAHGFGDYRAIWEHPDNAALKSLRKNPSILFPGDVVQVPEPGGKEESAATDARHRFEARQSKLFLRLAIQTDAAAPAKNADCHLSVDGKITTLKTDGSGLIEKEIPLDAKSAHVSIDDKRLPLKLDVELAMGHLDPIDKVSGQIGRLNNLGYDAGPVEEPATDEAKLKLRSAVEEFQCEHGLIVDGVCGPETQDRLKKAHGC